MFRVIEELTSSAQALKTGYVEGQRFAQQQIKAGLSDDLESQRRNFQEKTHDRRSSANRFFRAWQKGFDARYLGHVKQAL